MKGKLLVLHTKKLYKIYQTIENELNIRNIDCLLVLILFINIPKNKKPIPIIKRNGIKTIHTLSTEKWEDAVLISKDIAKK